MATDSATNCAGGVKGSKKVAQGQKDKRARALPSGVQVQLEVRYEDQELGKPGPCEALHRRSPLRPNDLGVQLVARHEVQGPGDQGPVQLTPAVAAYVEVRR